MENRVLNRLIFVSFFLSGVAALALQQVWVRYLSLAFGATPLAIATVTGAFMGGLAIGSAVGGSLARRLRNHALAYGLLEVAIMSYALVLYWTASSLPALHGLVFDLWGHNQVLFGLLRFFLVFVGLLPATVCMGATLPLLSAIMSEGKPEAGKPAGVLYAINTTGAVVGAGLTGFAAMPLLGLANTNLVAIGCSALAGTLVLLGIKLTGKKAAPGDFTDHLLPTTTAPTAPAPSMATSAAVPSQAPAPSMAREHLLAEIYSPLEAIPNRGQLATVLGVFFWCGLATMVCQILWARGLSIVTGSSVYSFTIVLVVELAADALGAVVGARTIGRVRRPVRLLGIIIALFGLTAAAGFMALDRLPILLLKAISSGDHSPGVINVVGTNVLISALVVLPASFLSGLLFPVVVRIVTRREDAAPGDGRLNGLRIGHGYAINTGGAIVGSWLGGFVILPGLGMGPGMKLVAMVSLVVGAITVIMGGRMVAALARERANGGRDDTGEEEARIGGEDQSDHRLEDSGLQNIPGRGANLGWGLACVALALLVGFGPDLRLEQLASGIFRVAMSRRVYDGGKYVDQVELLYYKDGYNSTITVERRPGELYTMRANGKPEASSHGDMPTQVLVGLLPILVHPNPDQVVLIGFGSGVTAGSILAAGQVDMHPQPSELVVVELEEGMVEGAHYFTHVNNGVLWNPRMNLIIGDGRNWLANSPAAPATTATTPTAATTAARATGDGHLFDVIISQPSNPWITGVSNLFTVEHFQAASKRLADGGVFCQWLQTYEISPRNVTSILATFQSVFPHVTVFMSQPMGADLILLGSMEPLELDFQRLAERAREWPGVGTEFAKAHLETPEDLAALYFLGSDEVERLAQGATLNTDDNALVEFSAPFDLIRADQYMDWFREFYYDNPLWGDPVAGFTGWDRESLEQLSLSLIRAGRLDEAQKLLDGLGDGKWVASVTGRAGSAGSAGLAPEGGGAPQDEAGAAGGAALGNEDGESEEGESFVSRMSGEGRPPWDLRGAMMRAFMGADYLPPKGEDESADGKPRVNRARRAERILAEFDRDDQELDVQNLDRKNTPDQLLLIVKNMLDGYHQSGVKEFSNLPPSIRETNYSQMVLGYLMFGAGWSDEAAVIFKELQQDEKKFVACNPLVLFYLGRSYYDQGKYREAYQAFADFIDALDANPCTDPEEARKIVFSNMLLSDPELERCCAAIDLE